MWFFDLLSNEFENCAVHSKGPICLIFCYHNRLLYFPSWNTLIWKKIIAVYLFLLHSTLLRWVVEFLAKGQKISRVISFNFSKNEPKNSALSLTNNDLKRYGHICNSLNKIGQLFAAHVLTYSNIYISSWKCFK